MLTRRGLLALVGIAIPAAAHADSLVYHDGRYYRIPDPDVLPDDGAWLDEPSGRPPRRILPDDMSLDGSIDPPPVLTPEKAVERAEDERQALASRSPIPRQTIRFDGYAPGTIIVDTGHKRLQLVLDDGASALSYGVGVGRQGFSWKGSETISAKRKWPEWNPPAEMIARDPKLPTHMDGGLGNPLGARALYLGETLYRIHGTNQPSSIGHSVSSGCIRLANADIIDLYERVSVGATVVVI